MNNLKTLSAAVAVAIGTAGIGVAQADEILFPYVVSSATVSTVLSVVNTEADVPNQPNTIHFRYLYKEGAAATDNMATCQEVNRRFTSSQNDLVDVSVDGVFGATTRGVLFNDPSTNANYAPTTVSLSLLASLTAPVRAYAVVDNNDDHILPAQGGPFPGPEFSMAAGRATILEFVNGAAWGYTAYNSDAPVDSYLFHEQVERYGEAFGPGARGIAPGAIPPARDGEEFSFKPFADFTTRLFVTPLAGPRTTDTTGAIAPLPAGSVQTRGNLRVRVQLALANLANTDVVFDRDENVVSGRAPQEVVCVGAVDVAELMSTGAQAQIAPWGGWGTLQTRGPGGLPLGAAMPTPITHIRTEEASIVFLEFAAADGAIDGVPLGGVINNGYMLREF